MWELDCLVLNRHAPKDFELSEVWKCFSEWYHRGHSSRNGEVRHKPTSAAPTVFSGGGANVESTDVNVIVNRLGDRGDVVRFLSRILM